MPTKEAQFEASNIDINRIPDPTGYRIVLAPIKIHETTAGGIIMTSDVQKLEETTRFVAKVLKMGPLCYKDAKFKEHPDSNTIKPWCKLGDIISIGQYTGSKLPCVDDEGKPFELRVINDDEVNCVISDPTILNI